MADHASRFANIPEISRTNGWNVPYWNIPSAEKFVEAEQAVHEAMDQLKQIERELNRETDAVVQQEVGATHVASPARKAMARFESSEWQAAWKRLNNAIDAARESESQWREDLMNNNR